MTKIAAILSALALAAGSSAQQSRRPAFPNDTPPIRRSATEKKVLETIDRATSAGEMWANVPTSDGRLIRILTESINARNAVEIGTSTGISGLWFALALDKTGGKLTTFEIDKGRAAVARKHFQQAGMQGRINLVEGDAHRNISALREPIDIVFIDAEKDGYVDYLKKLLPLVRPGGLILAHNTDMIPDYMKAVTSSPDLDTVVYTSGAGMAVTIKKR